MEPYTAVHDHYDLPHTKVIIGIHLMDSISLFEISCGDKGPPRGNRSSVVSARPFSITPACRYLLINKRIFLSLTLHPNLDMRMSWLTLSKNFSKSISTTHSYPSRMYSWSFNTACWAFRLFLKP